VGQPILVRYGRVKLAEEIAERLGVDLVIHLIGERPGGDARAACSLSAYLVYRLPEGPVRARAAAFSENPAIGFESTVISNIYPEGLPPLEAGAVIAERALSILEHEAAGNRLEAELQGGASGSLASASQFGVSVEGGASMNPKLQTPTEFLTALGEAASGLLFPSESDYPLTPYRWVGDGDTEPTPEALLQAEGRPADTHVETRTVEELFGPLIEAREGWNEEERAEAERYRAIVLLLEAGLRELRVLRVGKIDIDVYVLGQHASGEWLGYKTRVVET
jgi:hypothetical protein